MRALRVGVALVAVCAMSCAAGGSSDSAGPEAAAAEPSVEPAPVAPDSVEAAPVAEAPEPVEPEPEPEPPPPPPTPEPGVYAAPCADAPEGFACVPGGWFTRGIDADPHECDQMGMPHDHEHSCNEPSARVWVDTFYMHIYEVTNADWAECAEREDCDSHRAAYHDFREPGQPVTGVSWYDANTFCASIGGHLPTEAEWELAARGLDSEIYPWGNTPEADCDLAVIMDDRGRACGVPMAGDHPEKGHLHEPGTRPPGRFGLYDMVGNAEEWVYDWWTEDYDACGEECQGINPRGLCGGAEDCDGGRYRVVRGGSWYWPAEHATGYHRRRHYPSNDPYHHFGFRCAMSVDEVAAAVVE